MKRRTPEPTTPLLMRFTTGLLIDRRACPRLIPAANHWSRVDAPDGEPNGVCKCEDRT